MAGAGTAARPGVRGGGGDGGAQHQSRKECHAGGGLAPGHGSVMKVLLLDVSAADAWLLLMQLQLAHGCAAASPSCPRAHSVASRFSSNRARGACTEQQCCSSTRCGAAPRMAAQADCLLALLIGGLLAPQPGCPAAHSPARAVAGGRGDALRPLPAKEVKVLPGCPVHLQREHHERLGTSTAGAEEAERSHPAV